jgi:signal transduction histidine kinase
MRIRFFSQNVPLACAAALAVFVVNAVVAYVNIDRLAANERSVAHAHEVLDALEGALSTLKDAETGARGFLLTGEEKYLEPYEDARDELSADMERVRALTADNGEQRADLDLAVWTADRKMEVLAEIIRLRRSRGAVDADALALVAKSKEFMDSLRELVARMRDRETGLLGQRERESLWRWWTALISTLVGALLGAGVVGLAYSLFRRDLHAREAAAARLQQANDELEVRVRRRTEALERTNDALRSEVAERRRAEEKAAVFAEELQRSNGELQQFASVASHDLQEPLRKIQAFGDRLLSRSGAALDESAADYLRRMLDAAGRMRTLINDLLAFTRVASRGQPFVPVDLNRVAREVVSDLEGRLQQTGGRVDLGDLPTLDADPTQMRQLLQNLIGNALKFHRTGVPPVVTVAARPAAPSPLPLSPGGERGINVSPLSPRGRGVGGEGADGVPACEITVRDNGIGFDDKYADRIFGVFQRLHVRGEYEGTGMGLAICRKIAERHGGSVAARGAPGQGAVFIVTLPLTQPDRKESYDGQIEADYDPDGGRRPGRPGDDARGLRREPAGQ